jgi:hypothetical protein
MNMTLENLLAIRRLVRHEAGRDAILKLLSAARRNLADAGYTGEGVSDALLAECLAQAEALLRHTRNALGVS